MNPNASNAARLRGHGGDSRSHTRGSEMWTREDARLGRGSLGPRDRVAHQQRSKATKVQEFVGRALCLARWFSLTENSTKSTINPDGPEIVGSNFLFHSNAKSLASGFTTNSRWTDGEISAMGDCYAFVTLPRALPYPRRGSNLSGPLQEFSSARRQSLLRSLSIFRKKSCSCKFGRTR